MVSVHSDDENRCIYTHCTACWIGHDDYKARDKLTYVNRDCSSVADYPANGADNYPWKFGQPNHVGGNPDSYCVENFLHRNSLWNDWGCFDPEFYTICKYLCVATQTLENNPTWVAYDEASLTITVAPTAFTHAGTHTFDIKRESPNLSKTFNFNV